MKQRSVEPRTIKRRPKLDASAIALIVHYIEQLHKNAPDKGITWTELEARFDYSRQALEKHEVIKLAYRSANASAIRHRNSTVATDNENMAPTSLTEMKKSLAKIKEKLRQSDAAREQLLSFVVSLTQKCHEQGVSVAGLTLDLPAEYRDPIFVIEKQPQKKEA